MHLSYENFCNYWAQLLYIAINTVDEYVYEDPANILLNTYSKERKVLNNKVTHTHAHTDNNQSNCYGI